MLGAPNDRSTSCRTISKTGFASLTDSQLKFGSSDFNSHLVHFRILQVTSLSGRKRLWLAY